MAQYPCDVCTNRFHGEALRMYLNVFADDATCSFRYSVCLPCADNLLNDWLGTAAHQTPSGEWEMPDEGESLTDRLEVVSGSRNGAYRRR